MLLCLTGSRDPHRHAGGRQGSSTGGRTGKSPAISKRDSSISTRGSQATSSIVARSAMASACVCQAVIETAAQLPHEEAVAGMVV